jgi:hypothetical protein
MPLQSKGNKNNWHRLVASSGATECFNDSNLTTFPFRRLREITEAWVARKKLALQTHECDCQLLDLVKEHHEREGGSREIAVLACLAALSRFAALEALKSLRGDDEARPSYTKYLRCLVFAQRMAQAHFQDREGRIADALIRIRNAEGDPLPIFQEVVVDLGDIPNTVLLPPAYVNRVLNFCRLRETIEARLDWYRKQRLLMTLFKLVSWLRDVPRYRFPETAMEVLQPQFPSLALWNSWRPNFMRLMQWEGGHITKLQKQRLASVFDLEGPDMTHSGYETFKDAGPVCLQYIRTIRKDRLMAYQLLDTLDNAQRVGSTAVDLFIYVCVDNPASDENISFVGSIFQTGDEVCCRAAMSLLSTFGSVQGHNDQMVALTEAIPLMEVYPVLQRLAGNIREDVENAMRGAQIEYCLQVDQGVMAENLALKIHGFGDVILGAAWLLDVLSEEFLHKVQQFPPRELLQDIFENFQATPRAHGTMREYLTASLGGRSSGDVLALKANVEREQRFWIKTADPERARFIQALRKLPYIEDVDFLLTCQSHVLAEDIVVVRDILPIVTTDTNIACVDFVRILGRRRELNCSVNDVWIQLLLRMMENRQDEFLSWSCENLPADAWFQWLADLQLIYPVGSNHSLQDSLGCSAGMRDWWSRLSANYMDAVHYLEKRHVGHSSMKWLFLQEIGNIEILLDSIQQMRSLESHYRSIISYLEPNVRTISHICDCLTAFAHVSDVGRAAFKSILARHEMPIEHWPNHATQAFFLGWLQLPQLRDEDRVAINELARLMEVRPATSRRGIAAAKNCFLAEYEAVISSASRLEAMRVSLRLHDPTRTASLLSRLGIEDSRGVVDPDIPDELIDSVERVGEREYELCFPLTNVREHHRTIRGIDSSSRLLLVRISLLPRPGFCLHFTPGQELRSQHSYWRTGSQPPGQHVCTTGLDPFTYVLSRKLHRQLSMGAPTLHNIYDRVGQTISNPASECIVCNIPLSSRIWRPTTCGADRCQQQFSMAPLAVKAFPFLADPAVVDFMLACVYAAAQDNNNTLDLLPGCPIEKSKLCTVVNSFPPMPATGSTPAGLLNRIRGTDSMAQDRGILLAWMCSAFRGCMLSAPQGMAVPLMPGCHQFLMFNSAPELEAGFANRMPTGTGGVCFHGTPTSRLWRILAGGLKNMTGTPYMVHGAASGPGVYLADEPSMSLGYSGSLANTWRNSAFAQRNVLFGCELQGHTPQATHAVVDDARVIVRYIFLCPPGFTAPQARLIDNAMKITFASLRNRS